MCQSYLGNITKTYKPTTKVFRIICMNLTREGLLFNGISSPYLDEPGKLPPDFLAQLIKAGDEGLNQVQVSVMYFCVFRTIFRTCYLMSKYQQCTQMPMPSFALQRYAQFNINIAQ